MTDREIDTIARQLLDARQRQAALPAAAFAAGLSADDAYAIQQQCARLAGWFPEGRPRAWKVGAPSRDATPTAAPLPAAGVIPTLGSIDSTRLPRLGVEAEVAFVLACDVPDPARVGSDPSALAELADSVCVTIEVVDSRIAEAMAAPAPCKLADLQLHGSLVVGEPVRFAPRDWLAQRCEVLIDGATVADVTGTHPCADPLWTMRWLIAHAAARYGGLRRGDLVTTGAWAGIAPVAAGSRVVVRFAGIGEASARFS